MKRFKIFEVREMWFFIFQSDDFFLPPRNLLENGNINGARLSSSPGTHLAFPDAQRCCCAALLLHLPLLLR
jgi:hypothetical protein